MLDINVTLEKDIVELLQPISLKRAASKQEINTNHSGNHMPKESFLVYSSNEESYV
jgi:hypothetical protein